MSVTIFGRRFPQKRYWLLFLFIVIVTYAISRDEKYPFQETKLFENELALDEITKRRLHLDLKEEMPNFEERTFCEVYNVSRPYTANFECVPTKTSPSTTVCLYDEWSDMYISHDLKYTGIWEPQVLEDFQSVLSRNPGIGVLDLGANIGYYTMIAAEMGHPVVAVEPFYDSIYRIHRALQIEKLSTQVTVIHNAVSDYRTKATLLTSGDNQGDTRILMEYRSCIGSCPMPVNTILMDDLLEVIKFNTTIIKMDIQGFECQAMKHSEKLLKQLQVPYIFMEWGLMGQHYHSENHTSTEKYRIQEMIRMLFDHDYRPYTLTSDGSKPLDPLTWHKWPFDIIWNKLLDIKELEQVRRSHFINWP